MSLRYTGAWMQDGAFNPLTAPSPNYTLNLWSWGNNNYGQLGLGNTTQYSSPKQVGSLTDWSVLASSCGFHMVAIKTDGTLWAWGRNNDGQLGLNNISTYNSPKQIGSLTSWLQVSCGYDHTVATRTDGTIWAWGKNNFGQLGLGNINSYSSPKQIGLLTTWLRASCGYRFTIAVKTDGTMWSWGNNDVGKLGLNTTTSYSSPKQVGSLTTWSKISSGSLTTLAIKTDGTLWGWGDNQFGQLGLGSTTFYGVKSPTQVGALTTWASTSCGQNHSGAIKTDNTLWTCGASPANGLNTVGNAINFTQVGALTNWSAINCGKNLSLAAKTDASLWSWGTNVYGQLGLGTSGNYAGKSSPTQVGSLTSWLKISSSYYCAIALKY